VGEGAGVLVPMKGQGAKEGRHTALLIFPNLFCYIRITKQTFVLFLDEFLGFLIDPHNPLVP
jgi:hypothetical protein